MVLNWTMGVARLYTYNLHLIWIIHNRRLRGRFSDLPMFTVRARSARQDRQRPYASWNPRLQQLVNCDDHHTSHGRSSEGHSTHSRTRWAQKEGGFDELSTPQLFVARNFRLTGFLSPLTGHTALLVCLSPVTSPGDHNRPAAGLSGFTDDLVDLSRAITRVRARRIKGIKNNFHGASPTRDGSTWRHERVRYFPYGEWDRCSGDES